MDATYKLNLNEYPVLILGLSDAQQQFHLLSISVHAWAEDGEETLPSPSLLRFLEEREEAAGISIICYEMSY